MACDAGYTSEQLQKLEELFAECQFPNKESMEKWSKDLGMDPRQIKQWFENKKLLQEIEEKRQENGALRMENTRIELENMVMRNELDNLPRCDTCLRTETRESLIRENAELRVEHERVTNILVGILRHPLELQGRDTDVDLELKLAPPMDKNDD